jgi:hypothetical protein
MLLRASDRDREHIADLLRHAAAEGRLLVEELEQRVAAAFSARTYGELDAIVSDLPPSQPSVRSLLAADVRRRPARAIVAVAAVMAVLVTGAVGLRGHDAGATVGPRSPRISRQLPPNSEAVPQP